MKTKDLCKAAIVIALYVALTALNPIGYGVVQLRFSAILSVLPFFKKEYKFPLIIGVALANIFSPLGMIDVAAGILIWAIAYVAIDRLPLTIPVKLVLTAAESAVIVASELSLMLRVPFSVALISVFISQSIVLLVGWVAFRTVFKNYKKIDL
mgnify:CR=1 FL=1